MGHVHRVTLFKIADADFIPEIVKFLSNFQQEATKDGKQYVTRYVAGPTVDDARNQGFNFCIQSSFASPDDHKYYDETCEAHAGLKKFLQGKMASPPVTVFVDHFVGA